MVDIEIRLSELDLRKLMQGEPPIGIPWETFRKYISQK
jgi:hypothetical protein